MHPQSHEVALRDLMTRMMPTIIAAIDRAEADPGDERVERLLDEDVRRAYRMAPAGLSSARGDASA